MTLDLDAASQARFSRLRRAHYPAELNLIAAHLTLFHTLPATDEVRDVLSREAASLQPFSMRVTGVRSLGRGVAYMLESEELSALHRRLSSAFAQHLSAQDRQEFRPHVVVQNKVSAGEVRSLLQELSAEFVSFEVRAEGLAWWDYLGGPWGLRESLCFTEAEATKAAQ